MRSRLDSLLLRASFFYLTMTAAMFFFFNAFADAGGSTPSWALTWLAPYVPVLASLLAIGQAVVAREMTVTTGFWHTNGGHVVLTAIGAVVGALSSFVAQGVFTKDALIAAIAGAVGAFGGAWKTDGKVPENGVAVSPPPPPITKAAMLIPFLFFALASCATTSGETIKTVGLDVAKCALGEVPKTVSDLIPEVTGAINGSAVDWSSELTKLEGQGVDFALCAIEFVVHDLTKQANTSSLTAAGARALDRGQVAVQQLSAQLVRK
jgi:hypothetical protein